jgi:hypothetical protein
LLVVHERVQAALVLALHDPSFVERFRRDPEGVLGPLGLGPREREWLMAADPRAFRTDPLRPRRVLKVVIEELKASTTLALARRRSLAWLEGFFQAPEFVAAVSTSDHPMTLAFAAWLEPELADAPARDVLRLETMVARARRDAGPTRPGISLRRGLAVGRFDGATLDAMRVTEEWAFASALVPPMSLCDDAPRLPPLPAPRPDAPLHLLWDGAALGEVDAALHDVLAAFAAPATSADAPARAAAASGVPISRARALVDSLLEDGLLAEGPPPGAPLLA